MDAYYHLAKLIKLSNEASVEVVLMGEKGN